jgi:predicted dienelactone hydrolase
VPYVEDLDALREVLDSQTERVFERVRGHATDGEPLGEKRPLIIFSHGNDQIGAQYTFLIEELVSWGYAVAAIDHPYDARAVRLADGKVVGFAEWPPLPPANGAPDENSEHARFYRERVEARAADVRFVLDRIGDRFDLEHVGYVGHSVGGVAAGEVCRTDRRVAACINLDGDTGFGPFYLDAEGRAFEQPYLMITKPFEPPDALLVEWNLTREQWSLMYRAHLDRFFGAVESVSHRALIEGATHQSFSDEPYLFAALKGEDVTEHVDRMRLIRNLTVAFFETYLFDRPSTLDGVETWRP